MNAIRIAITSFILVLIALSLSGWVWTGAHQTTAQSTASRIVLGLCIAAGVIGLTALWRVKPPKS